MKKPIYTYIKILLGLVAIVLLFCKMTLAATSALETKSQELQSLTAKIEGLTSVLTLAQTKKQTLQQQLKPIEISMGNIANQLTDINTKLKQEQQMLNQLQEEHLHYQQQLQVQKILLGQQVTAAYMLGKDDYIKLLLNQNQPQSISRLLVYYRYLNVTRIHIINELKQTLTDLANNQTQIEAQTAQYQNSLQQKQQQQVDLQQHYQQRQVVINELTEQINTKSQKLSQLKINQVELQNLINKLAQQPVIVSAPKVPFAEMQGKLPWPTKGPITQNFGYVIDTSGTTYNGDFIAAPEGQPIYAVYPGTVVFANWLGGVGLLVIIQHDQDFMTLYGHVYSMLVKTGETVAQGQEIGTVGQSGGYATPGLFFQIRHDGIPIDPARWCNLASSK